MKRSKLACEHIEDSDQPAHLRSLIRVIDGRHVGLLVAQRFFGRKTKIQVRLMPMHRLIWIFAARTWVLVMYWILAPRSIFCL